jgi:hypothetical protein
MLVGMLVGIAFLVVLWWTGVVAWTWYAFLGAVVTSGTAVALSRWTGLGQTRALTPA